MIQLAVSLAICLLSSGDNIETQVRQSASNFSMDLYRSVPSVVSLVDQAGPYGIVTRLDSRGYYLAYSSSVPGQNRTRLSDGKKLSFEAVAHDPVTGLVLLKSEQGAEADSALPVTRLAPESYPGKPLIVVLPTGAVRGSFVSANRGGIVKAENRIIPLSEIRFESPVESCAGALVFTETGELIGPIYATLARNGSQSNVLNQARAVYGTNSNSLNGGFGSGRAAGAGGPAGGPGGGATSESAKHAPPMLNQYGPADLTVAYVLGTDLMQRAVDGLTSPSHKVEYPTLGVIVKDAVGGGALIQQAQAQTPANMAGLRRDDIIIGIGLYGIRNKIDFAKVMLRQKIGSTVEVRIRRNGKVYLSNVVIGS